MKARGNVRTFNVGCRVCTTQIIRLTRNPWKGGDPCSKVIGLFLQIQHVVFQFNMSICYFVIVQRGVSVWTGKISLYFAWAFSMYKCLNLEISEIVKKSILPSLYVKLSRKYICLYYQAFSSISWFSLQGLYSLSGKTSYRQISWSLEAARLDVAMVVSLWNLTGTSAAKFQSDWKSLNPNLAASRLHEILR